MNTIRLLYRTKLLLTSIQALLVLLSLGLANSNKVILISFDGFRWDYMSKTDTPNFDFIVRTGVKAPYIEPVFPAETLPNHYSMATGLYPESHGIISGYYMYDPVWNATFDMNNTESRWWDEGEPIWITNQKQGRQSGLCNFPGYDVKIKGLFPVYSTRNMGYGKPFVTKENTMSFREQVDIVMVWLTSPKPPSFVAIYFSEPDEESHKCGPDSDAVIKQIKRCDNITGYLLARLRANNLLDGINIVVTADHGHTPYNTTMFLNMDDYVNPDLYTRYGLTTVNIWPREKDKEDYVYKQFKRIQDETSLMTVYKTNHMPEKFHFKNNRRIPPIIAIMAEHWIANTTKFWEYWQSQNRTDSIKGEHVYSPFIESMRPFFIARGPNFKQGFLSEPFKMVDIYPLLCNTLDITPAPNNGSFDRVRSLLRKPNAVRQPLKSQGSLMKNFFTTFWKGIVDML